MVTWTTIVFPFRQERAVVQPEVPSWLLAKENIIVVSLVLTV